MENSQILIVGFFENRKEYADLVLCIKIKA